MELFSYILAYINVLVRFFFSFIFFLNKNKNIFFWLLLQFRFSIDRLYMCLSVYVGILIFCLYLRIYYLRPFNTAIEFNCNLFIYPSHYRFRFNVLSFFFFFKKHKILIKNKNKNCLHEPETNYMRFMLWICK